MTLRVLLKLVNHSLLERTPTGRYELHALLRQFGQEKLADLPDEAQDVHERHAAFYINALRDWGAQLKGPRQIETLAKMDMELPNIRTAWDWACQQRRVEYLGEGQASLGLYYRYQGRFPEGDLVFQQAVQAASAAVNFSPNTDQLRIWAVRLAWTAYFEFSLGQWDLAVEKIQRSLDLLEQAALGGGMCAAKKRLS